MTLQENLDHYNQKRMIAAAAREPLDYRRQHASIAGTNAPVVERFAHSLPDSRGAIGNPHRSYDTLGTLLRNGTIGAQEHDAGRRFEEDFRLSRLDALHASDPSRIRGQGPGNLSDAMVAGRRRVYSVMQSLGGLGTPIGSAIWEILGLGRTVKDWAGNSQFGQEGRSLDEKVAKGVFFGALGLLALHYGESRRSGRDASG